MRYANKFYVTTDVEHKNIKEYMENSNKSSTMKFIVVKEDLSHIFEINAASSSNGICLSLQEIDILKDQKS